MAIYMPFTHDEVTIIGRFRPQGHRYRFGKKEKAPKGNPFRFALVRYPDGRARDVDINELRADDGIREIHAAYDQAPEIKE